MNQSATQTELDSASSDWPRRVKTASLETKHWLKNVVPRSPESCEHRSRTRWLRFNEIGGTMLAGKNLSASQTVEMHERENIPGKGRCVWSDVYYFGQYESPIAPLAGLGP
jgi:hypothetical protein